MEPTHEMITECEEMYIQYKDNLTPNKKTGKEIIQYLKIIIKSPNYIINKSEILSQKT